MKTQILTIQNICIKQDFSENMPSKTFDFKKSNGTKLRKRKQSRQSLGRNR